MFPLPSANSVAKPTDSFLNLSASAGNAPPTSGALSFGIAAQSPNQFGLGAQASPQQASNAMSFAFSTNAQSLLATAPAPINSPAAGFVATSNKPVVSPAPFTGFGLSASTTSSTSQSPIFKPAFAGAPATPQNLFPTPSSKDFSLTTAASPSTPSLNFSFAPKLSSAVAPPIASSPQFSFTLPVSTAPTSTAPLTSDLGQSRGLQPSTTTADEQHNSKLFSASTSAAVTSFSIPASSAAASLAATIATSTTSDSPKSTFSFGLGTSFFQPPSTSGSSTPSLLTTVASSVSTSGGLVQQPKLTYRQLEELVNRWTLELDEQERHFLNEVTRLNQWDQVLISNAEKIAALHDKVEASKAEQTRIENELQFVEAQQRELEQLLEPLERAASELPPSQHHADIEREGIYQLATSTDLELNQFLSEIREIAEHVDSSGAHLARVIGDENAITASDHDAGRPKDPIGQVTRILNAHMHSLNRIHQNTLRTVVSCLQSHFSVFQTAVAAKNTPQLPCHLNRRLTCKQNAVRAVRFNLDGQYCMTAGGDKTVKLWNPYAGRLLKTYIGHGAEVSDVQSSHDNSKLCSGGSDRLVLLWDVATGQCLRRFRRHAGRVNAVRFVRPIQAEAIGAGGGSCSGVESGLILSVSVDGMLLAWDIRGRTPYPVQTMHEAKDSVNCLAVNKWQIVTGSVDRCIRIYDIRKGQLTEDFVGFPITSISLSIDAQCVLVGCQDSTIRLFDALTGDLLNKFSGHKNTTYRVDSTLMNYDAHVVSGSEDSDLSVLIWDLVRGGTEALICLSHSLNGPAFSARLTNSSEPVSGLARAAASASASAGSLFVHSISPHPKECRLLTAAGDYIWLWSSETEESTT